MENMNFLKAMLAEMSANMKANQGKADANTRAMQDMLAKVDTNRETNSEALKERRSKIKTRWRAK
jgi:hypothetical protein